MNGAPDIPDLAQRLRALDPQGSYIVQAPAGSGKTELLIQRYLALLACVEQPEEIAAITFTRKSAAEMRRRVLNALAEARSTACPLEPHRALTWKHARAAVQRDALLGWQLEKDGARLRVQTIDALCASLTRQMPVLSAFGAQPQIIEDASLLYREAAQATLALLEGPRRAHADDVARLLRHLDNNFAVAMDLLASMLARRDQWLRALLRGLDREHLENGLRLERLEAVERVQSLFESLGVAAPLHGHEVDDVERWQTLAETLLTQKGEWRKKSAAAQAYAQSGHGDTLAEALRSLRSLPDARYSDRQWELLGTIARLLPLAVAQLKLVFAARGEADFVEIAQGALAALGEPEAPTDLLLALDYRIKHILVDEYQDTSFTQFELLQRLTAGWQDGDARTLFLVGDPMQSIYRFREADVSLFLRARSEGLGSVRLQPLTLSANFRSQADIVAWVNESFARVLPEKEDVSAGAVPYVPSQAVSRDEAGGVTLHAFFNGDAQAQAERVLEIIASARAEAPQGTMAVLVRSRAHLEEIVVRLRRSALRFRAIEIEPLGHRQVVLDLLALTRALSHLGDRLAWLAVLRAPWCGMELAELAELVGAAIDAGSGPASSTSGNREDLFPETLAPSAFPDSVIIRPDMRTVWELMHDDTRLERLGRDALARLVRVREVLAGALAQHLRGSLRERVEHAWLSLGGPACLADDAELDDAEVFFDRLEAAEEAGEIADLQVFEQHIDALFALPDPHAEATDVQLLTIHKAKGLEFDTVIVPGLGSPPRQRDPSLLQWLERAAAHGSSRLVLAPVKETGASRDSIYDYLLGLEEQRQQHEDARLLYVAATRAKRRLHLLGDTRFAGNDGNHELKPPSAGSLLEKLWPVVQPLFAQRLGIEGPACAVAAREEELRVDQRLRRLPSDWKPADTPPGVSWTGSSTAPLREPIEFSWAGETARQAGSVVHRWLQRMAEEGLESWHRARIESLRQQVHKQLRDRGVTADALAGAADRVIAALCNTIEDQRGRWLLGARADARAELRVCAIIGGRPAVLVIDRLFTGEDGRRWIVDFKSSAHQGGDREGFLDRERERYRPQLERYAEVLGAKPCSLGLYFPLLTGWREWRLE